MAQTTATLVNNIRLLLRDARLNDLAIGTFQLRRLIENRVFYAADRLGTGETRAARGGRQRYDGRHRRQREAPRLPPVAARVPRP